MNSEAFIGLVNNAALLLALAVLYVTIPRGPQTRLRLVNVLTGFMLGAIGIAVMLTPWHFGPGVVFDTRSILLAVSGLFFGVIPTLMATLFTSLLRLYQGGAGAWTGVGVIVTSAGLGLAWGGWRRRPRHAYGWGELYALGLLVHVAMLLWMLTLPAPTAGEVLRKISLPVMTIYPLGTVLLGKLLAYQQARMDMEEFNRAREQRFRKMVEQGWDIISLLDARGRVEYASESVTRVLGLTVDVYRGMKPADWIHPDDLSRFDEILRTLDLTATKTIELRARHQDGRWLWLEVTLTNRLGDPDVTAFVVNSRNISTRKRADQELRRITDTSPAGITVVDRNGQITFANPFAEQVLGLTISEITQRGYDAPEWHITDYDGRPFPVGQLPFRQVMDRGQAVYNVRHAIQWPDGRRALLAINAAPLLNEAGEINGVIAAVDDVTEQVQAARQIQKLNRIYAVLSNINQAIVHVRETQSLLDRVCQVAVDVGSFRMVWIGLFDPAAGVILPAAHAGEADDYLEKLRITVPDSERGGGPTGRAVSAGEHVICNDIELDPRMEPWRADALRLGYRASAAFPLIVSGQVRGALNLYAGEIGFFDSAEIQLLDELAMNLSYAIEFIEQEEEQLWAEKRAANLADIIENSPNEVYIFDADTFQFIWANRTAISNLGYSLEELCKLTPYDIKADLERDPFIDLLQPLISGKRLAINFQSQHRRKNGSLYPVDVHLQPNDYEGRHAYAALILDITERQEAARALQASEARFRALVEQSLTGIYIFQQDRFIYVNQRFCEMFGYSEDEVLTGLRPIDVVGPDEQARASENIRRRLSGEVDSVHYAVRGRHKDGRPLWIEIHGSRMELDGQPVIMGTVLDITERRQAEEKIRQNQERLQMAQAIGQVGSWEYDLTSGNIWGSDEGFRIYGLVPPADNALPLDEIEACIPERERVHQALIDLLEQGKPYDLEFAVNPADGSPLREITSIAELIHDEQGNPLRVAGVIQDVTERRRAEKERRASEERFRRAVEEAPFPIIIHAEDGQVLTLSRTFTEITGYSAEEIPTIAEWTTRAYGDRSEQVQADIRPLYRLTERKDEGEYQILCKDNSQRTWAFSSTPLGRMPDGRQAVISMAADITERKAAEERLRRVNQRLTILREIDRDITSAQSAQAMAGRVLGHLRHLIECQFASLILLDLAAMESEVLALDYDGVSGFQIGASTSLVDHVFLEALKSGRTLIVPDLRAVPGPLSAARQQLIEDGRRSNLTGPLLVQGQIIGLIGLSADEPNAFTAEHGEIIDEVGNQLAIALNQARLTEELARHAAELEKRVAERTAELQARNRELETFTYSVSHDLKAPLRGIDGYSRLLLEDHARQLDEEGRSFVHTIRQATHQMNQLIEDLLAYSRLERRAIQSTPVNLAALVKALLDERRDELVARSVSVAATLQCDPVEADPDGLAMVLRNLLDNALKFTRDAEQPGIEIGGRESNDSCIVWVRDNGVGFDMQFHDRIFEIFQRLHRAEEYPGTGIGLAIVRKALERMGGHTWAESVPGQGATFYIEIPRT